MRINISGAEGFRALVGYPRDSAVILPVHGGVKTARVVSRPQAEHAKLAESVL